MIPQLLGLLRADIRYYKAVKRAFAEYYEMKNKIAYQRLVIKLLLGINMLLLGILAGALIK